MKAIAGFPTCRNIFTTASAPKFSLSSSPRPSKCPCASFPPNFANISPSPPLIASSTRKLSIPPGFCSTAPTSKTPRSSLDLPIAITLRANLKSAWAVHPRSTNPITATSIQEHKKTIESSDFALSPRLRTATQSFRGKQKDSHFFSSCLFVYPNADPWHDFLNKLGNTQKTGLRAINCWASESAVPPLAFDFLPIANQVPNALPRAGFRFGVFHALDRLVHPCYRESENEQKYR